MIGAKPSATGLMACSSLRTSVNAAKQLKISSLAAATSASVNWLSDQLSISPKTQSATSFRSSSNAAAYTFAGPSPVQRFGARLLIVSNESTLTTLRTDPIFFKNKRNQEVNSCGLSSSAQRRVKATEKGILPLRNPTFRYELPATKSTKAVAVT